MKISEFKKFIKEEIVEILSEEEGTISTKDETKAEKLAKKGLNVTLTEEDPAAIKAIDAKIQNDPEFLKKTKDAMAKAEKGDTTDLATLMGGFGKMFESADDAEPSAADLAKKDSVASAANKLQKLISKMKAKAKEYKEAEGDAKEKIKDELKAMTAEKKKLEKVLQ